MIAPRALGQVMDLHGRLLSFGLQQYEEAFRENSIDDALLPSLTIEDLKDIGVKNVGHRRKLVNAIAALGSLLLQQTSLLRSG
jgi:hypothetical protein